MPKNRGNQLDALHRSHAMSDFPAPQQAGCSGASTNRAPGLWRRPKPLRPQRRLPGLREPCSSAAAATPGVATSSQRVSVSFRRRGHEPVILGKGQPFFKGSWRLWAPHFGSSTQGVVGNRAPCFKHLSFFESEGDPGILLVALGLRTESPVSTIWLNSGAKTCPSSPSAEIRACFDWSQEFPAKTPKQLVEATLWVRSKRRGADLLKARKTTTKKLKRQGFCRLKACLRSLGFPQPSSFKSKRWWSQPKNESQTPKPKNRVKLHSLHLHLSENVQKSLAGLIYPWHKYTQGIQGV